MDSGGHFVGALLRHLPATFIPPLADPISRLQNDRFGVAAQLPGQLSPLLHPAASAGSSIAFYSNDDYNDNVYNGGQQFEQRDCHCDRQQQSPTDEVSRNVAGQIVREGLRALPGCRAAVLSANYHGICLFDDRFEAVAGTAARNSTLHPPEASA